MTIQNILLGLGGGSVVSTSFSLHGSNSAENSDLPSGSWWCLPQSSFYINTYGHDTNPNDYKGVTFWRLSNGPDSLGDGRGFLIEFNGNVNSDIASGKFFTRLINPSTGKQLSIFDAEFGYDSNQGSGRTVVFWGGVGNNTETRLFPNDNHNQSMEILSDVPEFTVVGSGGVNWQFTSGSVGSIKPAYFGASLTTRIKINRINSNSTNKTFDLELIDTDLAFSESNLFASHILQGNVFNHIKNLNTGKSLSYSDIVDTTAISPDRVVLHWSASGVDYSLFDTSTTQKFIVMR